MVQFYSLDSDEEPAGQLALPDPNTAYAATETSTGALRMTPKIPPTFDGTSSWFEYEDLIEDWLGITTLNADKIGPSLKNALIGPAVFYKNLFDNAVLRDPNRGLNHFKETMRPYFVKGKSHVFMYRFLQVYRTYRGSSEMVHWIGRFEINMKRLRVAWNDLYERVVPQVNEIEFVRSHVAQADADYLAAIQDEADRRTAAERLREQIIAIYRQQHDDQFPLNDNLIALTFLVQADLSEAQRERFVSSMSLRQVAMNEYTYQLVKQLFLELFCSTRTGVADPSLQHRRKTTFLVIEEGEHEDEPGFWVVDEETQEEGFVSLYCEEDFWILQAEGFYQKRRVAGRTFKRSGGKGKGGKKGRRKRPGFKPRSKGKGYATGNPDDDAPPDPSYFGKGKGKYNKGKGKGKGKGKDAYKGGWKGGKPSKGKGKPSGSGPPEANLAAQAADQNQPAASSASEYRWDLPEDSWGYGNDWWGSANYTNDDDTTWDDTDSWWWSYYVEVMPPIEETEDGQTGQNNKGVSAMNMFRPLGQELLRGMTSVMNGIGSCFTPCMSTMKKMFSCSDHSDSEKVMNVPTVSTQNRMTCKTRDTVYTVPKDNQMAHAYLNYQHGEQDSLLCEYIDLNTHPTYVILDSGCTRAMGSRFAIDRLVQACRQHKNSQLIWFETEPCSSRFSFANGEQSTVKEKLVIYFKPTYSNTGWISTSIDILDKGKVPILFSVEQMRNLRMTLEHTPAGEFMTCPMFGMKRTALAVSTSNHPVLDIMALATSKQKPQYSFQSSALYCPACAGKHRPHTYTGDCKHASKDAPKAKAKPAPKKKGKEKKYTDPDKKLDLKSEKVPTTRKDEPMSARPDGTVVAESSGPSSGHRERPDGDERTRIVKVNVSKIRKDRDPIEDIDVPLDPVGLLADHSAVPGVSQCKTCSVSPADHLATDKDRDPATKIIEQDASQLGPEGFVYQNYHWEPCTRGRIDFLELFAGSARLSQVAAMNGLKVGPPVDIRTGYDILTVEGRQKTMELIERLNPKVVFMAPVCGPWSQMQNINDQETVRAKREKYFPMVEFCAKVALYQLQKGGYFLIENPSSSRIWFTRALQALLSKNSVTWDTLDMCAFGMRDPNGYYYYKPTSLLHNLPSEVIGPVFKRCTNKSSAKKHWHQPIEGSAPGYGSRTKLAQVYPYRFCSALIRSILPLGRTACLLTNMSGLVMDLFEDFSIKELSDINTSLLAQEAVSEHTSFSVLTDKNTSLPVRDHFNKRTLNKINALPTGQIYVPVQLDMHGDVSRLRQTFVPTMAFDNAIIFRGNLQALRVQYRQTSGVLLLWRKKDVSHLFILQHPGKDLSQLIPQHWSGILYYNTDGRVPNDVQQPQPMVIAPDEIPPGLPSPVEPNLPPDAAMIPVPDDDIPPPGGDIPDPIHGPSDDPAPMDGPDDMDDDPEFRPHGSNATPTPMDGPDEPNSPLSPPHMSSYPGQGPDPFPGAGAGAT
eukprot:Skav221531  [mRNA]  locus=scaffold1813:43:5619:- [translate_table: standard]